jgi:hypothetical protein
MFASVPNVSSWPISDGRAPTQSGHIPQFADESRPAYSPLIPSLTRGGWQPFQDASRSLGLKPFFVEISAAGEIGSAMASLAQQRAQAVISRGDSFADDHRLEIIGAAMKYGLPTMAEQPDLTRDGGARDAGKFARRIERRKRTTGKKERR